MKTTVTIVAGITILIAAITNRVSVTTNTDSEFKTAKGAEKVDKGSYLASDFAQFKRENLREDLSVVVPVSEKVLFKAFVKQRRSSN